MLLSDIWATSLHYSQPKNPFVIVGKQDIGGWFDREDSWKVRCPQRFKFSPVCFSFFSLFVFLFSRMKKVLWESHYYFTYNNIMHDFTYITYEMDINRDGMGTFMLTSWSPSLSTALNNAYVDHLRSCADSKLFLNKGKTQESPWKGVPWLICSINLSMMFLCIGSSLAGLLMYEIVSHTDSGEPVV